MTHITHHSITHVAVGKDSLCMSKNLTLHEQSYPYTTWLAPRTSRPYDLATQIIKVIVFSDNQNGWEAVPIHTYGQSLEPMFYPCYAWVKVSLHMEEK